MTIERYIQEEIEKHMYYVSSIRKANSAFSVEYYHPKTDRRIACSERDDLVRKDLSSRVKKITKKLKTE